MTYAFISYSHSDGQPIAEEIYELLNARALNPWRDKKELLGGDEWSSAIDDAIDASYAMVVIATPKAMQSIGVTYEWSKAMGMGRASIKVILLCCCAKEEIPKQFSPIYWFNFEDSDFRDNIIRTLTRYQQEDGLVNICIPSNADIELKTLARLAFDVSRPLDENLNALSRLGDMLHDEVACEILIEGLNKREHSIRSHILSIMNKTHFNDTRVIPKLKEFLLLPAAQLRQIENQWAGLRSNSREILSNMGKATIDALAGELNVSSIENVVSVLETMAYTKHLAALPHLGEALQHPELRVRNAAAWLLESCVRGMKANPDFDTQFDEHVLPIIRVRCSLNAEDFVDKSTGTLRLSHFFIAKSLWMHRLRVLFLF